MNAEVFSFERPPLYVRIAGRARIGLHEQKGDERRESEPDRTPAHRSS